MNQQQPQKVQRRQQIGSNEQIAHPTGEENHRGHKCSVRYELVTFDQSDKVEQIRAVTHDDREDAQCAMWQIRGDR